jgi:hypothetical protein
MLFVLEVCNFDNIQVSFHYRYYRRGHSAIVLLDTVTNFELPLFFLIHGCAKPSCPLSTKRHSLALCWDIKWASSRHRSLDAWFYNGVLTWQWSYRICCHPFVLGLNIAGYRVPRTTPMNFCHANPFLFLCCLEKKAVSLMH